MIESCISCGTVIEPGQEICPGPCDTDLRDSNAPAAFDNPEAARWYLAGMIDGEGCVVRRDDGHRINRRIKIANTERAILESCLEALDVLGINAGLYRNNKATSSRKESWDIVIHKQSEFLKAAALIPVQHPMKSARLAEYAAEIGIPRESSYT